MFLRATDVKSKERVRIVTAQINNLGEITGKELYDQSHVWVTIDPIAKLSEVASVPLAWVRPLRDVEATTVSSAKRRTATLLQELSRQGCDGLDAALGVLCAVRQDLDDSLTPGTIEHRRAMTALFSALFDAPPP